MLFLVLVRKADSVVSLYSVLGVANTLLMELCTPVLLQVVSLLVVCFLYSGRVMDSCLPCSCGL
jgi:hypothetical protein